MAHEQLNTDSRSFDVKFKDGSVITHTITWIGAMDYDVREDGGPSTITAALSMEPPNEAAGR